jgi:hypothetical protein
MSEQKHLKPHDDPSYSASFEGCMRWGSGAVVIGTAGHVGAPASEWLLRLDERGNIRSETTEGQGGAGYDATELPDGTLAIFWRGAEPGIMKLDGSGKVVAQRALPADPILIQPLFKTSSFVVALADSGKALTTFWRVGSDLQEELHFDRSESIGIGRGYELPDHSLVLFGSQEIHVRENGIEKHAESANIGRVYPDFSVKNFPVNPLFQSGVVADAVPADKPHEFAIVRITVWPIPGTSEYRDKHSTVVHRCVLTWIGLD